MNKLLISLDTDIKRCEEVLSINNYLEIVIAIEELIDKYKNEMENIIVESNRIWSYSKKDLENILEKLKIERNKIIKEYTENQIDKLQDLSTIYYNIKLEIENNKDLLEIEKKDILIILKDIYKIGNENKTLNEKWENLKFYISKASEMNLFAGSKLILLINIILQN